MQEIRQNRGLAYSVYSSFSPLRQEGPFEIGLQTKKEQSEESLRITQQVLAKFIAGGPTQKELISAKQNIIGGFPLRLDSNKKAFQRRIKPEGMVTVVVGAVEKK
jgi:zinc protease